MFASEKGVQREHPTFATIAAGKYELVTYSYLVNSEFTDTELRSTSVRLSDMDDGVSLE